MFTHPKTPKRLFQCSLLSLAIILSACSTNKNTDKRLLGEDVLDQTVSQQVPE